MDNTVLIGVAAWIAGSPFIWDAVFELADAALYRAKEEGRDRVVTDGATLVARAQLPTFHPSATLGATTTGEAVRWRS